jgi:molybdate transport system permease protein
VKTSRFLLIAFCVALWPAGVSAQDAPRIYGASSLTDVLETLADRFEKEGGSRPRLSLGGSSRLARQVQEGAAADIIIVADPRWLDVLANDDLIDTPSRRVLLTNRLVIAVPKTDLRVEAPGDLAGVRRIAVAAPVVPAGQRAREALTGHGLLPAIAGKLVQSPSVRAALALAARGEVDAAIVYRTDALAEPKTRTAYTFRESSHQPIRYPIALTPRGAASPAARALYAFLVGSEGASVFAAAGFGVSLTGSTGSGTGSTGTGNTGGGGTGSSGGTGSAGNTDTPLSPPKAEWRGPLFRSLWVATLSLLLIAVPGVLLGWLLARRRFPGKSLLSTALMTPLVLPPVVTGYLLLWAFGRNGPLAGLGLELAFTRWGAVIASATVGFPLLIIMARTAIEAVDPRYEQLAETLGRRPLAAFVQVTLPMALPGVAAGCVLAFARALGEFGATAVLAGDVPGETRTLALAVFALYEQPGGAQAAQILIAISLALCFVALVGFERLTRGQRHS